MVIKPKVNSSLISNKPTYSRISYNLVMKLEPNSYSIRHATLNDVTALARIQHECFGDEFLESEQSNRSKLESNPQTCFIAEHDNTVWGYIIGLAVDEHSFPILNAPSISMPENPTILYLHDLSVLPSARGTGVSELLIQHLLKQSVNFEKTMLISVQNSLSFWQRYDFSPVDPSSWGLEQKVLSFGDDAVLMIKN